MKTKALVLAALITLVSIMPGCKNMTGTQKGAAIGAGSGAAIGALIGKAAGNTAIGALIGGAVGGVSGAYIGKYMDKQKKEIEETVPNAKVEEINNGEALKVTLESGVLFDVNKYDLKEASKKSVKQLSEIMVKYPDTYVQVKGHTDNTGKPEYNMTLSQKRAEAVMNYAISIGVDAKRLMAQGMGITEPVADNNTVEGRAQNRRVEFFIVANDKLKQEAAKSTGGKK